MDQKYEMQYTDINQENGYLEMYNRIITDIRLTQRRISLIDNPSSSYEDFVP